MNTILDNGAFKPEFAHKTDAGADLRSPIETVVPAHGSVVIDTGVHVEIPEGYVGMLKSKSGLNVKHDLIGTGTIMSIVIEATALVLSGELDEIGKEC